MFTALIVIFVVSLLLVETILGQWFDPRHSQMENRRKLIELSLHLDSLEYEVYKKELFINNFQKILTGEVDQGDLQDAQVEDQDVKELKAEVKMEQLAEIDSQFRSEFESGDAAIPSFKNGFRNELQEMFLFSPIDGIISSKYDVQKDHYGVDIVSRKNEPVKCVADGTVIISSWTQDSGYVIAIQHRSNLISVYKHNDVLLKKVGNFVGAGEIISITGNTGELTDGTHLHFELWYNGNPVNPEEFVSF